jgi:hypothetical protein
LGGGKIYYHCFWGTYMIPILDLSGLTSNVVTAVNASGAPADIKAFVVDRLALLPDGSYARVKVFDERVVYPGFDSRQTSVEISQIPQPLWFLCWRSSHLSFVAWATGRSRKWGTVSVGAWGLKPFENDSAHDWLSHIERPIIREITFALRVCDSDGYHEAIAAADLLLRMTEPKSLPNLSYLALQEDLFKLAVFTLNKIKADKEWVDSWAVPSRMRRQLNKLLADIVGRDKTEAENDRKLRDRLIFRTKPTGRRKKSRLIARTSVSRKLRAKWWKFFQVKIGETC